MRQLVVALVTAAACGPGLIGSADASKAQEKAAVAGARIVGFGALKKDFNSAHPVYRDFGNDATYLPLLRDGSPRYEAIFMGGRALNVTVNLVPATSSTHAFAAALPLLPKDARPVQIFRRHACQQFVFRSPTLERALGGYDVIAELQSASDFVYLPSRATTVTLNVYKIGQPIPC